MTLYVGGLDPQCEEADVKDVFYQYGTIISIRMVPKQACAFVEFSSRSEAELAANKVSLCSKYTRRCIIF